MSPCRRLLVATVLAASAWPLFAADDAGLVRYGAVSVVGDQLTVVTHVPTVGSMIDHNRREIVPFASTELDDEALAAVKRGLARSAGGTPALYRLPAADFPASDRFFDGDNVTLPEQLVAGLEHDQVTRLLLVTKYRGVAELQLRRSRVGSGTIEGLGFYIDTGKRVRRPDTGEVGAGFLAPFVYVQVSMVDVATRHVLRREVIVASTTVSAARGEEGFDAWSALNASQKARVLKSLLGSEVTRVVARMTAT